MLLLFPLLVLPLLTAAETVQPTMMQERWKLQLKDKGDPVDWVGDGISNVVDNFLPVGRFSVEGI